VWEKLETSVNTEARSIGLTPINRSTASHIDWNKRMMDRTPEKSRLISSGIDIRRQINRPL
jgi:hypothetical protein